MKKKVSKRTHGTQPNSKRSQPNSRKKLDKVKIESREQFDKLFFNYLKGAYLDDKLFYHDRKQKQKLTNYFELLYNQAEPEKRIVFIQGPGFNGVEYLIDEIKQRFKYYQYVANFSKDFLVDIFSILQSNLKRDSNFSKKNSSVNNNSFVIIQNLPLELMSSFGYKNNPKAFSKWKSNFQEFLRLLRAHLKEKVSNTIIIFWWDDTSVNEYVLNKLFDDIINDPKTIIIRTKAITGTRAKTIITDLLTQTTTFTKDYINDLSNYIQNQVGSNLAKIKEMIYQAIITGKLPNLPRDHFEDKFLFHLVGKILYNKRIDPYTGEVRQMTKQELIRKPIKQLYFKIQDILDNNPISKEGFNELLIEGAYVHFVDLKELADAADCFSYTNTIHKFEYTLKEQNYPVHDTIENMKFLLNANAIVAYNYSQYNVKGKNSYILYKKAIYNYKINFDDKLYEECLEYNNSISSMSRKKYISEIEWAFREIKKHVNHTNGNFKQQLNSSFFQGMNNIDVDKLYNQNKKNNLADNGVYSQCYDPRINDLVLENTQVRQKDNLKKRIKNKTSERQEEFENMIGVMLDGNQESNEDPYDSVDED